MHWKKRSFYQAGDPITGQGERHGATGMWPITSLFRGTDRLWASLCSSNHCKWMPCYHCEAFTKLRYKHFPGATVVHTLTDHSSPIVVVTTVFSFWQGTLRSRADKSNWECYELNQNKIHLHNLISNTRDYMYRRNDTVDIILLSLIRSLCLCPTSWPGNNPEMD